MSYIEEKYNDDADGRKKFEEDLLAKYVEDEDKNTRNLIEVWNDWWDKRENHNGTRTEERSEVSNQVESSDLKENNIQIFTSVFIIYLKHKVYSTGKSLGKSDDELTEYQYIRFPENVTIGNLPADFPTEQSPNNYFEANKVIEGEEKNKLQEKFEKFKSAYDGWNEFEEKNHKVVDIVYNLILRRVFPADREKLCKSAVGTHIITSLLATVTSGLATYATLAIAAPALVGLASIGAGPGGLVIVVFCGAGAIAYGALTASVHNAHKPFNARIRKGVIFGGNQYDKAANVSEQQIVLERLDGIPEGFESIEEVGIFNNGEVKKVDKETTPDVTLNPEIEKKLRDPEIVNKALENMPPIPEPILESAHLKLAKEFVADVTATAIHRVIAARLKPLPPPPPVRGGKTRRRPKRKRSKTKRNQKKSNKRRT